MLKQELGNHKKGGIMRYLMMLTLIVAASAATISNIEAPPTAKWVQSHQPGQDLEWIAYHGGSIAWVHWAQPERATQFDPTDFNSSPYPVQIQQVRNYFYLHPSYPWDDSTFYFVIYADDGQTELYVSPEIEAVPYPSYVDHTLSTPVLINSGTFWLSVRPYSSSGFPSCVADGSSQGHSFYGSGGSWTPFTNGEYFKEAYVEWNVGVAEETPKNVQTLTLPSVCDGLLNINFPTAGKFTINVYDLTGSLVHTQKYNINRKGTVSVDLTHLATAIYFIRISDGLMTKTSKLAIIR